MRLLFERFEHGQGLAGLAQVLRVKSQQQHRRVHVGRILRQQRTQNRFRLRESFLHPQTISLGQRPGF